MKFELYREAVKRTLKDLGPEANLAHMALGFHSELSEIEECLKRDEPDKINLMEELGDMLWYTANWANMHDYILFADTIFTDSNYSMVGEAYSELIIQSGKLSDIAKRYLAYGQSPQDQEWKRFGTNSGDYVPNIGILGNLLRAIHAMCLLHGLDIEMVMAANIAKLSKRYPDKFSNEDAIGRSIAEERSVLETFYNNK